MRIEQIRKVEKAARCLSVISLALLAIVIAAFWLQAVKAASQEGPGGVIIDPRDHYNYASDRYEPVGKVQAPVEVMGSNHAPGSSYRDAHIISFTACRAESKSENLPPVVYVTLRWYPADGRGNWWTNWVRQTTTWKHEERDGKSLILIHLYSDITNERDVIDTTYIMPTCSH